jgi:dihydrofolate reductase
MRKIILYSAVSMDNYIATADGSVDWLDDPRYTMEGEDFGYSDFYKSIDITLMGYRTYHQVIGFDVPFPYKDKTNFVFTRGDRKESSFVHFISSDIPAFVKNLKDQQGKNIWLIGGGQINTILLENDLIDTMILTTIPIILGSGIRLFEGSVQPSHFRLSELKKYDNGFIESVYQR